MRQVSLFGNFFTICLCFMSLYGFVYLPCRSSLILNNVNVGFLFSCRYPFFGTISEKQTQKNSRG